MLPNESYGLQGKAACQAIAGPDYPHPLFYGTADGTQGLRVVTSPALCLFILK